MQQHTHKAAVGVELGTSTTTVSIFQADEAPRVRRIEGSATLESILDDIYDLRAPTAPVAFAVPVAWDAARRRDLASAAERAGLGDVAIRSRPEAAAAYYTEVLGRDLDPGGALLVYDLGSSSCEVAVVGREGDRFTVLASGTTGEVGGREFDQLVLAYLSGRHRDTDPEFWDRVDEPNDIEAAALRASMVDEVKSARERLSEAASALIALPETELELELTREELESCLGELVGQTVDLAATVMDEAGVAPDAVLMTGGASRTPLAASRLADRIGLERVLPADPQLVSAEGAALAAHPAASALAAPSRPVRGRQALLRIGVLASLLVTLVGATAIFGSNLGAGDRPEASFSDQTSSSDLNASASPSEGDPGSGGAGGEEPQGDPQTPGLGQDQEAGADAPPDQGEPGDDEPTEGESDREESAPVGTVPDVVTLSSQDAKETLADVGFSNVEFEGEERGLLDPWYDDCEVIAQDPPSGTRHTLDTEVTLTYSYSGSDTCEA